MERRLEFSLLNFNLKHDDEIMTLCVRVFLRAAWSAHMVWEIIVAQEDT